MAGSEVERVVAAVLWIEPGNLCSADVGTIGVNRGFTIVDHNLPGGAAHRIGAGKRRLALLGVTVHRPTGQTSREDCHSYCQNSVAKHNRVHIPGADPYPNPNPLQSRRVSNLEPIPHLPKFCAIHISPT